MGTISKISTRWPILIVACGVLISAQPGIADDRDKVIGFWKLVSYVVEVQATGQIEPVMGQRPTGYVNFSPEGRVMFILTGEGRKPAKTAEERADLLNTLVAYTGTYRIEGDRWVTKVDVAWNPDWVGTEQSCNFRSRANGCNLTLARVPNWREGHAAQHRHVRNGQIDVRMSADGTDRRSRRRIRPVTELLSPAETSSSRIRTSRC
jgi:hypothetical protein